MSPMRTGLVFGALCLCDISNDAYQSSSSPYSASSTSSPSSGSFYWPEPLGSQPHLPRASTPCSSATSSAQYTACATSPRSHVSSTALLRTLFLQSIPLPDVPEELDTLDLPLRTF